MAEEYSKKTTLRLPPQDVEAEQALLGSLMLKPQGMDDIIDHISEDSFYAEKHKLIFRTMLELHTKSDPIDLLSLSARLKDKKQLEQIGGASYLSSLVELVPSASNLKHYGHIVERKAALRHLIESAEDVLEMGYDGEDEIDEIFDKAEKRIFGIKNVSLKQKFISLKDGLSEAWERLDKLHKSKGEIRGVETGYSELDAKLAGLQKSDLIILAARPSMGKTSLALDIARQTATKHGNTVGVFSLEMSSQQLVDRMLAGEAHVDSWKLRTGQINNDSDFTQISEALDRLSRAPIFIDDEASNNIIKMRAMARRLKSEHDLKLIIVDYLQLMVPNKNSDSLVQQVTEISRSLKGLARELDVPVLAISQLSRAVEQRRGQPRLSDLRDSGSIEQDADVVMFIHREDKFNEEAEKNNIAKIIIAKHRNGPTGEIDLYFDEKRASFTSIEKNNLSEF
ncbi:replicative DNA helicase [bacterium]|nr:replicative DNA helicase [bacterium]|tara:strand:+ start:19607 stop:20965 length:1359 start_codon:yes stop_codon:yes gene_type:complete